jgi:acetyl esterase/lipase
MEMRRWMAGLVAMAVVLPDAPVSAQPSDAALFARWDNNGDGRLTPDEVPERLRGNFARVDTDSDGSISPAEHAAIMQRQAANRPNLPPPAPAAVSEAIELTADIPYAGNDNPRQRLDLLLPTRRKDDALLPVLVFIHGGGWLGGDKSQGRGILAPFVATGTMAGVTVGYRLSGEARWPAQIHDCKAAIRWIRANAERHRLDPTRVVVWGASAGGHLALMLATTVDVPALDGDVGPHASASSRVTGVVNFFGPTDFLTIGDAPSAIDHDSATAPEALLLGGAIPDTLEKAKEASPTTHVSAGDPPILTLHGTKDPIVPYQQAEKLHAALAEARVGSTLVKVVDGGHGFGQPEVRERVRAFVARYLLGEDVAVSDEPIQP